MTHRTTLVPRLVPLLGAAVLLVGAATPALAGALAPGVSGPLPAAATAETEEPPPEGTPPEARQPPADGITVTWGVQPADADGEPDERVSYRYELDPGASTTDTLLITNFSEIDVVFDLVSSDGVVTEEGVFDLLPPGEEPVDVGSWIDIAETVAVPAGETATVPFTLTVPADATPGDHPGGIVASVSSQTTEEAGAQVGVSNRTGLRVHLRVAGEITPQVAITDVQTRYEPSWNPFSPGELHVEYRVLNEGNVRLGSIQQYEVAGPYGVPSGGEGPSGTVIGQQREILPGQSAVVRETVEGVWPVVQAVTQITAHHEPVGEDEGFQIAYEVASAEATVWAVPWPQLALLALLALLVVGVVARRRRRRTALERRIAAARAAGAREALAGA